MTQRDTDLQLLDFIRRDTHQLLGNLVESRHPDSSSMVHQIDLQDVPHYQRDAPENVS